MLPDGVSLHRLQPHADSRGVFTELFRNSWELSVTPVQWSVVRSHANVLRGVHVHSRHIDYLTLVAGWATIVLHDLREGSSTEGVGTSVELTGDEPRAITIPTGVAHGFYFHEPSLHVYSMSHEWDPSDEMGCRWDDPELGVTWSCSDPLLSKRDESLGSLSELRSVVRAKLVAATT